MMTHKFFTLTGGSVAMAILVFSSAAASAQSNAYTVDVPVTAQATNNTCAAGEPVILNGAVHLQYGFTTDTDGVNHFSITATNDLNGVGQTSGASYKVAGSSEYTVNAGDPSAELYPDVKSDLTPLSSGTPLTLVQSMQITVDTSGNLTGQINQVATQCAN